MRTIVPAGICLSLTAVGITSNLAATPVAPADDRGAGVLDVEISAAQGPKVWGREGAYPNGRVGIGIVTTSHNVGTVNVDWIAAGFPGEVLDNRHPFIGQNMYRLRSGRLEQIGLAWIKHGFYSVNDGCPDPDGEFLGVGCFDTYGNFTNANRQYLGPRSEINPLNGYWEPCGSHFDTGEVGYPPGIPGDCISTHFTTFGDHDNDDHRLRVADQDVIAADATNRFFTEGFYIVAGDENIENNFGYRKTTFVPPGVDPDWTFLHTTAFAQRPVIDDWGDAVTTATPTAEGKVRVAARVVTIDATHNRYEYNIFNMNLDRQIDAFTVPLGPGVTPTDFGFFAPIEDEEPQISSAPWTPTVNADSITWAAPAPNIGAGEELPNTIRYGTMYTFWFAANTQPGNSALSLHPFRPGAEDTLTATLPAPCLLDADINGDGIVDTADLGILISQFGTLGPEADVNGDGVVDTADLGQLISMFGADCIAD